MLLPRRQPREPTATQKKLAAKARKKKTKLTLDEKRAIAVSERWEQAQDAIETIRNCPRWLYLEAAGNSHWQQTKQQAARLGLKLKEETDLLEYINSIHRYLAENKPSANGRPKKDLTAYEKEKIRNLRVKRRAEQAKLAQQTSQWIPRGEIRDGLAILSQKLRQLGDRLARMPGESEAHELLEETLLDIDKTIKERFGAK